MYLKQSLKNQRVLMTVKTYPNLSRTYGELVCTAGITPEGKWIRIYPLKFRHLHNFEQFRKYQWIEIDLIKKTNDFRIESYTPCDIDQPIRIVGEESTADDWIDRLRYINRTKIYTDMSLLIQRAKENAVSLATLRPKEIIGFTCQQETEREWTTKQLAYYSQPQLFHEVPVQPNLKKLPYKFKYKFITEDKKIRELMIEDWEIGMLYWNCINSGATEIEACKKVKKKYFDMFVEKKDLLFFLGTTIKHHNTSHNPFIVIGIFYPPKRSQLNLLDTFY